MKQIFILAAFAVALPSCHHLSGSGNIITEKRLVSGFTGVSVSSGIEVEFTQASSTSVEVEADDNVIQYITTKKEGDILRIGIKSNTSLSNAHLKVYISSAEIKSIRASSGSDINIKGSVTNASALSFDVSSSGTIQGDVDAPSINLEASSGGEIKLAGKTKSLHAKASSGASIKGGDLLSETTNARASSGADIYVHASVSIDAQASSGASIHYNGAAKASVSQSSGGSVVKNN